MSDAAGRVRRGTPLAGCRDWRSAAPADAGITAATPPSLRAAESGAAIRTPGAFAKRLSVAAADLDLEVEDVGAIRLPVSATTARKRGRFFARHQASEREDDIIGTLALVLPSAFEGGAPKLEHGGEQVTYRLSGNRSARLTLIAFHGDCRHDVRAIKKGHRIVLTYNLLFDGPALWATAPADESLVEQLSANVDAHFRTPRPKRYAHDSAEAPDRLLYLLDHEYSQRGLHWQCLKNSDWPRAAALSAVADRLDCEIHRAQADVHETWSCHLEGYYDPRARRDFYADDDGSDDDSDGEADFEPLDLLESDIVLRHWIDESGKPAKGLDDDVSADGLDYTTPSSDLAPSSSKYEGWMGNYSNTVDRWYRRFNEAAA